MCSMIDSGEKGYKLPEQILFNSLVLYLTLAPSPVTANYIYYPSTSFIFFVNNMTSKKCKP